MAVNSLGLPEDFDPEKLERPSESRPLADVLRDEDVTVLGVTVAKRMRPAGDAPDGGAPDGGAPGEIRCWRCYRQPDGSYDCIQIDCPPGWPPPTHVDEVLKA